MALIKCPKCNHEISDTIKRCIHCGTKIQKKQFTLQQEKVLEKIDKKTKTINKKIENKIILNSEEFKTKQNKNIYKISKKVNKKMNKLIITIVLLLIIVIALNIFIRKNKLSKINNADSPNIINDNQNFNEINNNNVDENINSFEKNDREQKDENIANVFPNNDIVDVISDEIIAYNCPDGYEFDGHHPSDNDYYCKKYVGKSTIEYYCTNEDEKLVEDKCVYEVTSSIFPTNGQCPNDFELNDNMCVHQEFKTTNAYFKRICPNGNTTGSSECYEILTLNYSCPTGYTINGYNCYKYTCPAGYTYRDYECHKN